MRDDHTPIRRTTRKRGTNWTPIILGGVAVACGIAFVVGVMARAGRNTDAGRRTVGLFDPYPQGTRLLDYSKWWTDKATPQKIQRMVNDLQRNSRVLIYFNSDADFTRVRAYSRDTVKERYGYGSDAALWLNLGVQSDYQKILYFSRMNPDDVADPDVIESGRRLELRSVNTHGFGRQLTADTVADLIEDILVEKPLHGSGRGETVRQLPQRNP